MIIPFTEETKDSIVKEQKAKGKYLVEVQNYKTGQFLRFEDTPPPPAPLSLEQRIIILENQVNDLRRGPKASRQEN